MYITLKEVIEGGRNFLFNLGNRVTKSSIAEFLCLGLATDKKRRAPALLYNTYLILKNRINTCI